MLEQRLQVTLSGARIDPLSGARSDPLSGARSEPPTDGDGADDADDADDDHDEEENVDDHLEACKLLMMILELFVDILNMTS